LQPGPARGSQLIQAGADGTALGGFTVQQQTNINADSLEATLLASGQFLSDEQHHCFYLNNTTGIAIPLASRGFDKAILAMCQGSKVSGRIRPLIEEVRERGKLRARVVRIESCSAYDEDNRVLRVNIGGGWVAAIHTDGLHLEQNFAADVLFVDEPGFDPVPWAAMWAAYDGQQVGLQVLWAAVLRHLPPPADGGLTVEQQGMLIQSWWLGIFLGDMAKARPILALLGPPGSGKTEVARLLGMAFYGPGFDVSGGAAKGRAVKDLAAAVTARTLVCRDDVNDAPDGFMDLLCRIATGARFDLSKFYETLGLESYEPKAALAITAHQPAWALREDVQSRLLTARFRRPEPTTETARDRTRRVQQARFAIWAETLMALQLAIASEDRWASTTRFPDWENVARRVAGWHGALALLESALAGLESERVVLAIAADPELGLLHAWASKPGIADTWFTAAQIVENLAHMAGVMAREKEPHLAPSTVRSTRSLARFLAKIEREGSTVVNVTRSRQPGHGNRYRWNVRPR